jgi:hypothetical protein
MPHRFLGIRPRVGLAALQVEVEEVGRATRKAQQSRQAWPNWPGLRRRDMKWESPLPGDARVPEEKIE